MVQKNPTLERNFNACARAVEKCRGQSPDIVSTFNRACVFEFPLDEQKQLPTTLAGFGERLSKSFFLPFPIMGVLNDNTLTIIWDKNLAKKTIGVTKERNYLAFLNDNGQVMVTWGTIENVRFTSRRAPTILDGFDAGVQTEFCARLSIAQIIDVTSEYPNGRVFFDGNRLVPPPSKKGLVLPASVEKTREIMDAMVQQMIQVVGAAYMDVAFFNTPNRFVVEVSPERLVEVQDPPRAKRYGDRAFYTLLTPNQIKKRMGIKEDHVDQTGRKIPYRRAHERYLGADCFVHMQGQTIFVKAVWNFEEQRVVDKKRYRVMLEV